MPFRSMINLFQHQQQALDETEGKNRVAYYLDMGLGKTFVGSEKMMKLDKRINLVVCQCSKVQDWIEHFQDHYTRNCVFDLTNPKTFKWFFEQVQHEVPTLMIGVINYELTFRRNVLKTLTGFTLMLDESSLIQNENAKRSKFILGLKPDNVILLSGTPTGGKYENLWSQCQLLGWKISKELFWKQYIQTEWVETDGFWRKQITGYITANENTTEQKPLFDVATFLGTVQVDLQEGVAAITDLKANAYVDWKSSGTLSLTASLPLTGGTNGTVADSDYQTYLDQAEAYTFNAMGCTESKATITALFAAFAKRMRDDVGKKFQVVLFRKLADYEGVVSVKNGLTSDKTSTALIPWVTGVIGGTAVNKSATNMTYDGEYDVDTDFTQTQLENGIKEGSFMFHRVDEAVCVLTDINSFISITDEKSSDFSSNQTIRVLDQIANDIAVLFGKKYLGKVPNDAAGRISLWNDIVKHHTELQDIRAIENFSGENVTVEKGDTKKSVVVTDYVTPVNAMEQLYMTVYVQ